MRHALWPSRPFCEGYKNLARTSPNPPPLTPLVTCAFVFAVVRFLFSIAGKAVLRPLTPHDVRAFQGRRAFLYLQVRGLLAGLATTCAFCICKFEVFLQLTYVASMLQAVRKYTVQPWGRNKRTYQSCLSLSVCLSVCPNRSLLLLPGAVRSLDCIIRGKTGYTHPLSPSRPPNNTLNTQSRFLTPQQENDDGSLNSLNSPSTRKHAAG